MEFKKYSAQALQARLSDGRAVGKISFYATGLKFSHEHGSVEMDLRDLQIRRGGANNSVIFFSHPQRSGWEIFTSDRTILKDAALRTHPELLSQVRRGAGGVLAIAAIVLAMTLGLGALSYALWNFRSTATRLVVDRIPVEWEQKLGELAFTQVKLGKRFVRNQTVQERLNVLVAPLMQGIGDKRYEFQFHIVEDASLNAFALPGGNVVIHSGLLLKAGRAEEVLGVLAHEVAHVTRRHGMQQMVGSAGLFLVVQAMLGDVSGLLAVFLDNGSLLLTQKFSRDHEREADDMGYRYLTGAGIDPRGMITFFQKVELEQSELEVPDVAKRAMAFLSTHPDTAERIKALQARADAEHPTVVALAFDYPHFQAQIRSVLEEARPVPDAEVPVP